MPELPTPVQHAGCTDQWPSAAEPLCWLTVETALHPARRALLTVPPTPDRLRAALLKLRAWVAAEPLLGPDRALILHVVPAEPQGTHTIPATFFVWIDLPAPLPAGYALTVRLLDVFHAECRSWCFSPVLCPPLPPAAQRRRDAETLADAVAAGRPLPPAWTQGVLLTEAAV